MNVNSLFTLCCTLSIIATTSSVIAQYDQSLKELELEDRGKKIENTIEIYTSKGEYNRIKAIDGNKISIKKTFVIINGDSSEARDIHTRGKTTLLMRRKSFSFSLESKITIYNGPKKESFKKFYAICLSMDKNYFRNRLAFELMGIIQLFDLFYSYGALEINENPEGIYLIIERPQDWALKRKGSPLVIRRGYDHDIEKINTGKKIDKPEAKNYKSYYTQIYKSLNKYDGKELYDVLSQWMDLEMYMKWLAFNIFVRNGDYTDEVYLYFEPDENRFKIIPWDYDDIFAASPHEGMAQKKKSIGNKLIFSSEDKLDQKIANDPFLYEIYLIQFKNMLEQLTPTIMKNIFENIYAELLPYYSDPEIIGMAEYDIHKKADITSLKNALNNIYAQLNNSRMHYFSILYN